MPADLRYMATTKAGLGRAIKFGFGAIVTGLALLSAYKSLKRAARSAKHATEK
jgi:hypothetical protein